MFQSHCTNSNAETASHPLTLAEAWRTHTQIFLNSLILQSRLAAQQPACTCLLCAAVTTPSAPNSTITLYSVTEFKVGSAVWQGFNLTYSDESVSNISQAVCSTSLT